jgi:probable HAF family extracellular repeat protein
VYASRVRLAGAVLLLAALTFPTAHAQAGARAIDRTVLGSASDCLWSGASAINAAGDAAGDCLTPSNQIHAALWRDGKFTDLGTLGGTSSTAAGINATGQVVGQSFTLDGQTHAFLWENGTMLDLGTLGGTFSAASAINNRGQVVGTSTTADESPRAFLWHDGVMTDLGTLGGAWSGASDINDRGQVVGSSPGAGQLGPHHAFVWERGRMTDLGMPASWSFTSPYAINASGDVVGQCGTPQEEHACLYRDGSWVDLGALEAGTVHSGATDINSQGQIVGYSSTIAGGNRPILWHDAAMVVLDANGGAAGINDRGQIVGTDGQSSVMWTRR